MSTLNHDVLLEVSGLETHFPLGGRWSDTRQWVRAVNDVSLDIRRGEVLGVVGESGSGKTTLGRSILRLVEPNRGSVIFDGIDVLGLPGREMRRLRKRMQMIFQDPYKSLSPRMQVGQLIAEPIRLHKTLKEPEIVERVIELLAKVGLEPYFRHRYPHEMSGGQRQRVHIARAIVRDTPILILDEHASGLDAKAEAAVNAAIGELTRDKTTFVITHRLNHAAVADKVLLLGDGPPEFGAHQELMHSSSEYRDLQRLQAFGEEQAELPRLPERARGLGSPISSGPKLAES